ncbi:MAG TPA: hypothetical protein VGH54_28275 [Mycobacterium sp.]|jgi:hypothetical protein|uniref:hypothetical protein n=1 Tax=Mycobacterium sp. TaxID=1785 RepID=UPI002F3E3F0E
MQNIFHIIARLTEGKQFSEAEQKVAKEILDETEGIVGLAKEHILQQASLTPQEPAETEPAAAEPAEAAETEPAK